MDIRLLTAGGDVRLHRRRLPHLRVNGAISFVTFRIARGGAALSPTERTLVMSCMRHFDGVRYELLAAVVMDDHVHVLVRPFPQLALERILHTWKSFTAHAMVREHRRVAPVWLDESFDRIVRSDMELDEKATSIVANPWKRWPTLDTYEWVHMAGW